MARVPVRCPVCGESCALFNDNGQAYCPGRCRLWFDPAPGASVLDRWTR